MSNEINEMDLLAHRLREIEEACARINAKLDKVIGSYESAQKTLDEMPVALRITEDLL